jgi:hypothetical protein
MQLIHAFVPRTASDLPKPGTAGADAVLDEFKRFFAELDNEVAPQHQPSPSRRAAKKRGVSPPNCSSQPNAPPSRDYTLDPMVQSEVAGETRRKRELQTKSAREALEAAVAELREATEGDASLTAAAVGADGSPMAHSMSRSSRRSGGKKSASIRREQQQQQQQQATSPL